MTYNYASVSLTDVPEASISLMRYGREEEEGVDGTEAKVGVREETEGGLRAGDSATLTCTARANPPAYNFTFMFNVSIQREREREGGVGAQKCM